MDEDYRKVFFSFNLFSISCWSIDVEDNFNMSKSMRRAHGVTSLGVVTMVGVQV
jgi:hypothetical protein